MGLSFGRKPREFGGLPGSEFLPCAAKRGMGNTDVGVIRSVAVTPNSDFQDYRLTQRSIEFEEQVLEHLDMLYAVALQLTRNVPDAEDLTQNALVKALRFHDKFKEGTYIKAWLLTILRNTFINEYRKRSRTPLQVELTGTEAAETPPGPKPTHDSDQVDSMLELLDDEVRLAVADLPEDFRQAVIMADLEERSYKEIAEIMGCPIGTVMSRLYRGRKLLREQLADYAQHRRRAD